jgi:CDP-4-dehydro-6-deoxyglucose reductase
MPLEPWRNATVIDVQNETPNTKRFFLRLDEVEVAIFKPGQFITLDLPIHEKPNKRWRSYSIASWPNGTNIIELVIVLLEGGAGTNYLFNEVSEGSVLTYRGPIGVFTLPDEINTDLYFICTGTGIAPFRSMIHYILEHKLTMCDLYLIFGTRTKQDLLYYQEMTELSNDNPQFKYLPTLSREEWDGANGYVHELYLAQLQNKPAAAFYLCGWKNMVDDTKTNLLALGYDKKSIHIELYG